MLIARTGRSQREKERERISRRADNKINMTHSSRATKLGNIKKIIERSKNMPSLLKENHIEQLTCKQNKKIVNDAWMMRNRY